ncbi:MAG: glycine/sarcosine/betaine reductase selenoprotein B family protein [Pseudomonadales bacterium]
MANRPPVDYIQRTREQYDALGYPPYRWVYSDTPPPFVPLAKPLRQSRLGLIASGGIYRVGQIAFHFRDDLSYREIDVDTPVASLRATHFAYDLTDARADPNVVFPLETLRRCVREGLLGGLAQRAFTFMGGIYSSSKVRDVLAPALAQRLRAEAVDAVLLVPV